MIRSIVSKLPATPKTVGRRLEPNPAWSSSSSETVRCLEDSVNIRHGRYGNNHTFKRQFTSTRAVLSNGKKTVSITYIDAKLGTSKTVDAEVGMDLMNVAHEHNIDLEGACGGELACSTCHLIFEKEIYDTLPEMEEEEVDMLDLAFKVTDTSRLGCQILVREDFEGMTVTIPDDGF
jgi:ferredoxin